MEVNQATENVGTLAKFINDYGPTTVILAVFIILFGSIMFLFFRRMEKMAEENKKEREILFNKVLEERAGPPKNNVEYISKNNIMSIINANHQLSERCKENIANVHADRLAVYLFHNGTHAASGFPFIKFSCICEETTKPIFSKMNRQQDFPINLVDAFIEYLLNNEIYYKTDEDNEQVIDPMIMKLLYNIENTYIIGLLTGEITKSPIGFVLLEFESSELSSVNLKKRTLRLKDLIKDLTPILEWSNYNETYKQYKEVDRIET